MLLRRFAVFLIGFTAISTQIVLLREFISIFHGNELVIGVYLSVWLLATAAGSGPVARLFSGGEGNPSVRFAVVQSLSGVSLLLAVVGLLFLPGPLRPAPGETAGLLAASASAVVFLFPFCLLQGILFSLGTRLLHSERTDVSVSRVYLLESLGAGVGGLLFSFFLVRLVSTFQNVAMLSAINMFTACFVLKGSGRRRLSQVFYLAAAVVAIFCVLDPVTYRAAASRWEGFRVVALRQSPYGNLAVVTLDSQFSIYEDGVLIFSTDDVQTAEETAHIPLLEHPAPRRVLLIGGGVGGAVREILKHSTLVRLDYVELDPELITLSRAVLPSRYVSDLRDPRVRIQYTDGRRFLQRTRERYDVVAMQVPPPYTAQLNRFYTEEFFTLVKGHLDPGGVFVFSAPAVAEYVGEELGAFLGSLYRTSKDVFETTVVVPASRSFFVCSPGKNPYVETSPESLLSRLAARDIRTLFVRDYFLASTLSRERVDYVTRRVVTAKVGGINTDLKPISFYYDLVLWSAEYERSMKRILGWVFKNGWSPWAAAAATVTVLVAVARSKKRGRLVLSAVAVSGFAAIVVELEILLCYQMLYGNLYDRIGVLLTLYMLGLAAGAFLERRWSQPATSSVSLRRPAAIQVATAVFAVCFLGFVHLSARLASNSLSIGTMSRDLTNVFEWSFSILAFLWGILGGALFGSATRAFFAGGSSPNPGRTYAWDLVGSWLGAVLCSVVFFPVVGIATTTVIVAVLVFASGMSLAWGST